MILKNLLRFSLRIVRCTRSPSRYGTDVAPPSHAFNHPSLNLSLSFSLLVIWFCSPHGMDPSDHDSDQTTDDEHDVQPCDLEELAAVDFCHGRLSKLELLELYSIH